VISTAFTGIVFFESTKILLTQLETKQVSAAVQVPMWLPYLGVTFGTFLMTIRFIEKLVQTIRGHKHGGEIQ
jgi:TRAP-type C4-dicarboxylate transport system permease small subunit